jgi:hypothetical protein
MAESVTTVDGLLQVSEPDLMPWSNAAPMPVEERKSQVARRFGITRCPQALQLPLISKGYRPTLLNSAIVPTKLCVV